MKNIGFATITVTGVNITTGAASASAALPVASSGEIARFYRLTATGYAHFRLGAGAPTAVATDAMLIPSESFVIDVPRGLTHIAAIQDSAASTVNVAPLEDC